MKDFKSELDKVEFDIFRIKAAIDQYINTCKKLGFEPNQERIDDYLSKLYEYMKRRDELKKQQ